MISNCHSTAALTANDEPLKERRPFSGGGSSYDLAHMTDRSHSRFADFLRIAAVICSLHALLE